MSKRKQFHLTPTITPGQDVTIEHHYWQDGEQWQECREVLAGVVVTASQQRGLWVVHPTRTTIDITGRVRTSEVRFPFAYREQDLLNWTGIQAAA